MADETRPSGEPAGPPRRRRVPPPTIDLQATAADAPSGGGDAAPSDPAPPDAAPHPPAGEPVDPAPSDTAASPPPTDNPPPPEPAGPQSAARPSARWWPQLAAGALGAALALAVAAGLWARFSAPPSGASDVTARQDAKTGSAAPSNPSS